MFGRHYKIIIAVLAFIVLTVVYLTTESAYTKSKRNWEKEKDSLRLIVKTEQLLRKQEAKLRKESELREAFLDDSIKRIHKRDSVIIKKEKALTAKYKRLLEKGTNDEIKFKLDSIFTH